MLRALCLSLCLSSVALANPMIPKTTILEPNYDTYIDKNNAASSFNGNGNLQVIHNLSGSSQCRTLMTFDLSSIDGNVTSASLGLKVNGNSGDLDRIGIYNGSTTPSGNLTWNGFNTSCDPSSLSSVGSLTTSSTTSSPSWSVSASTVNGWKSGTNTGLVLARIPSADPVSRNFYSYDIANSSNRPKLTVNHEVEACAGDSNLDGVFNSSDLVLVSQAGLYETATAADWEEGDWNGDGYFNSSDLIYALQQGCYADGNPVEDFENM